MSSVSRNLIVLAGLVTAGGCAGTSNTRLSLPQRYSLVREQLVIHSDFPLPAQHRLLEELTARRFDISRAVGLPVSDEPVHVYLFEDAERFKPFMRLHHPEFPERRAFFVETDTRLIVYAHWGDRVAEDLRHEVTHVLQRTFKRPKFVWGTSNWLPGSSVGRFLLELEAHRVHTLFSSPSRGALMSVWRQPSQWGTDLAYLAMGGYGVYKLATR